MQKHVSFILKDLKICLLFADNNFENTVPKHRYQKFLRTTGSKNEAYYVITFCLIFLWYSKKLIVPLVNISIPAFTN